ncbi:hypothetical protein CEXT_643431 [Caerostris extrusa]|uniref:Uncharacterized protein n=1 Tax=Caerostris extrusa TaxID=172846 RepID=A0AAV4RKT2_CAEEX|nr:hypothetical protein CEXT_643431 [Caerostris extrusa]
MSHLVISRFDLNAASFPPKQLGSSSLLLHLQLLVAWLPCKRMNDFGALTGRVTACSFWLLVISRVVVGVSGDIFLGE